MSFLDGELAAALGTGFDGNVNFGTLTKMNSTGRDPSTGDAVVTPTPYAVQGFVDGYSALVRVAAGIPTTDSKVVLIAALCSAVPAIGDIVAFTDGQYTGVKWQIRNVGGDPAGATYECQSFKI